MLSISIIFHDKNSKTFFISLGLKEKAEKLATTLANRSFSYFFFIIDKISSNTTCNINDSDFFAYIATNQYLSNKFYRIMIDAGVYKYSITGYGQYMTYTRKIKDTTINISKVVAIYV